MKFDFIFANVSFLSLLPFKQFAKKFATDSVFRRLKLDRLDAAATSLDWLPAPSGFRQSRARAALAAVELEQSHCGLERRIANPCFGNSPQ